MTKTKTVGPVFCVNCRHYLLAAPDAAPLCARSRSPSMALQQRGQWLVTGAGKEPNDGDGHYHCAIERGSLAEAACGPEGKFYVERWAAL